MTSSRGCVPSGCSSRLDDFGTGYASLGRLRALPFDICKIDRSFVAQLGLHPAETTVVRVVTEIAYAYGLRVLAEGVENPWQADHLARIGCDFAQGYHLHRPMPSQDLARLLAARSHPSVGLRALPPDRSPGSGLNQTLNPGWSLSEKTA